MTGREIPDTGGSQYRKVARENQLLPSSISPIKWNQEKIYKYWAKGRRNLRCTKRRWINQTVDSKLTSDILEYR